MREGESHLIKNAGFLFFQNRIARKPATGPGKVLITLSRIKVHFLMFPFLFNNTLLSSLPNKMEALGSEGESRSGEGTQDKCFRGNGWTDTCYQDILF